MLSLNRLAMRQLMVRKPRTLLIGLAISLGVAATLSLILLTTSGSAAMERQAWSSFGLADIQVYTDISANQKQVIHSIEKLPGVKGAVIERVWQLKDYVKGKKIDSTVKGIDNDGSISPKLYPVSEGRLPRISTEIALSKSLVGKGYHIGERFILPMSGKEKSLTISGFVNDGVHIPAMIPRLYITQALFSESVPANIAAQPGTVMVMTKSGLSKKSLAKKISKVSAGTRALSSEEVRDMIRKSSFVMTIIYGALGVMSLMVGAIIAYSAFAVTATEREREFALLKTLGAARRKLRRLVYREAFLLGLVFSLIGVVMGLAMIFLYTQVGVQTGLSQGMEFSDIVIAPQVIILAFVSGIVVTFFSAMLPARKVGKVSPMASIRPQPSSEQKVSRVRWVGLIVLIAGAVSYFMSLNKDVTTARLIMGSAGPMAIYIGAAVFMPVIIVALSNLFSKSLLGRIGIAGKLAAKNMSRQSVRNAHVVVAILVCISVVADVASFNSSYAMGWERIKENVKCDVSIFTSDDVAPAVIPGGLLDKIRELQEVEMVTTVKSGIVKLAPESLRSRDKAELSGFSPVPSGMLSGGLEAPGVYAIDPMNYQQLSPLFFPEKSDVRQTLGKLKGKYVVANKAWAETLKFKPGDKIRLVSRNGKQVEFTLLANVDSILTGGSRAIGCIYMSQENAERYFNINKDCTALIKLKSDSSKAEAVRQIKRLAAGMQLEVLSRSQILKKVDQMKQSPISMVFLYGVLSMTILVSVLGVVNTVAINILRRRPEIGLIKAIGGTGAQVRYSIILETILLSLTGSVLGVVLGTGIASIQSTSMYSNTLLPFGFAIPVSDFAIILLLTILVSIVGALVPIRLANKVTPITALRFD